jgi:hypothetical protein
LADEGGARHGAHALANDLADLGLFDIECIMAKP